MFPGQRTALRARGRADRHPAAGRAGARDIPCSHRLFSSVRKSGVGGESSGTHFGAHAFALGESRPRGARLKKCGSRRQRRTQSRWDAYRAGRPRPDGRHACGRCFPSRRDVSWRSTWDSSCNVCGSGPPSQRRDILLSTTLSTDERITTTHRAKLAYVYVRQSSPGQVRHHQESTELQYRLVERAAMFGWPRERVHVIDDDLGKSGTSSRDRYGFRR
jgi:hypothetical protein